MKTRRWNLALTCFVCCFLFAPWEASAQVRAYMRIENIRGSSTAPHHEDWIELEQTSRDVKPATSASGPELLAVVKLADSASGQLQQAWQQGTEFRKVEIEFTRPGSTGEAKVFQRLTLEFAKITAINQQYAAGKNVEEIKFSYKRVAQEDKDVETNTKFQAGWDFVRNIPF